MPKLSRKQLIYLVGLSTLFSLAILVAVNLIDNKQNPQITPLVLGKGSSMAATYALDTVTDPIEQAKGLSGRPGLEKQTGMLFSYGETTRRCMWMKDMRFNIDIIWLDASYRISSIVPDLSPSTYPQSYCADARYVVELPAGSAAKYGLRVGQIIKF